MQLPIELAAALARPLAVVVALLAAPNLAAQAAPPDAVAPEPGAEARAPGPRRALDFGFEDINPASATHGQTLKLSDLYRGRGVVLQFVASWCEPCRDELPHLQALHDDDVPVVLVAADEYGYTEGILIVAERSALTAPLLFVPVAKTQELERFYDHDILPATYLIGPRGDIREVHQGALTSARLDAAIARGLD